MAQLYEYKTREVLVHHSIDLQPDAAKFPMHAHEQCEIHCFLQGKGKYMVEGHEYPLEPGTLLIMRPAETHRLLIDPCQVYERMGIHFSSDIVRAADPSGKLLEAFENRKLGESNLYLPKDFPSIGAYALLKEICNPILPEEERSTALLAYLLPLLHQIRAAFLHNSKKNAPAVHRDISLSLIEYINTHLFENLSLEKLSGLLFLSKSQLERIFQKATGSPISEYIAIKRLMEARRMIQSGSRAAAVARHCGFKDYSTFFRAYKKRFGCSPASDRQ